MTLEELRRAWTVSGDVEIQRSIWNRTAPEWADRPLPDRDDPSLRLLLELSAPGDRCLDIGCGDGRYALALAGAGRVCLGVDLSPEMIALAERRRREAGTAGVSFQCGNWAEARPDQDGFDLVFARMTPAVAGCDAFLQMMRCCRGWCMLEKHTQRHDAVLDAVLSEAGIAPREDQEIMYARTCLDLLGCTFHEQVRPLLSRHTKSEADMTAWCLNRARLRGPLTDAQAQTIRRAVSARAEHGIVEETLTSQVVTLYWKVPASIQSTIGVI